MLYDMHLHIVVRSESMVSHLIRANDLGHSMYVRRVPKSLARIEQETVQALCTAINCKSNRHY